MRVRWALLFVELHHSPQSTGSMSTNLPEEVQVHLAEIVRRLQDVLESRLVGVYLFGSAGYGAYEPGVSDSDVQVVCSEPLKHADKESLIGSLIQETLPCPARKLELVIYSRDAVRTPSRSPRFELNLNTGPHQSDHTSFDPSSESSHWLLLDIAMGRELGRCLHGLPATEVFAALPRDWILEAIGTSIEWHQENELTSANSVLNACQGWRYITTDTFGSKLEGAR